jgi:two-component system chemotaxis response regulator CheY
MKTLIVDDEIVCRRKMEFIMKNFGDCHAVAAGEEAISAFKKAWEDWSPFSLIMLDVSMPGKDGTETLFEIRQMEQEKNVPPDHRVKVIMTTARSDKSTVCSSIQAGCDGYIIKPFDRDKIQEELSKLWKA